MRSKGKHPCHNDIVRPKEEGFGETRRKHLCQSGKCNQRKRALVKPEGSTYAGARSDHRIPGKAEFEHISKLVAIKKRFS